MRVGGNPNLLQVAREGLTEEVGHISVELEGLQLQQ